MTTYTEQIKEFCETNSIKHFISDDRVLMMLDKTSHTLKKGVAQ